MDSMVPIHTNHKQTTLLIVTLHLPNILLILLKVVPFFKQLIYMATKAKSLIANIMNDN